MAQPPLATFAAFPAHLELLRARFANASIAVVGSSGTLLYGDAVGAEIDAHDVVVRVNQAYTQGWEARTGSRTDVRVLYSGGLASLKSMTTAGWRTVLPGELLVYSWLAENPMSCDVADADGASCLRRHDFSEDVITGKQAEKMKANHVGAWHLHTEVPGPELLGDPRMPPSNHPSNNLRDWSHYRANPVVVLSHHWIGNLHQAALSGAGSWPSTGFIALALALALSSRGKRVSAYGFGACRGCGKYYQCKTTSAYEVTGYHSFEMEAILRRRWADEALIHLHEPACEGVKYHAVARHSALSPPPLPPEGLVAPCERLALWWHDPWRTRINNPTTPIMIWCSGWSNGWGKEECALGYWWRRPSDTGSPTVFGACEWNEAGKKCTESNQTWACDKLPPWPPPLPSLPPPLVPSPTPLPPRPPSLPMPLPPLSPSSLARHTWLSQTLSGTSAWEPLLIIAAVAFGAVVMLAGVLTRICRRDKRVGYRSARTSEQETNALVSWTSLVPHSPIEQLSLQQPVHASTTVLLEDTTESGTMELAVGSEILAPVLEAVLAAPAAAYTAAVAAAREDGDGSETGVAGRETTSLIVNLVQDGGARTSLEADAAESFIL